MTDLLGPCLLLALVFVVVCEVRHTRRRFEDIENGEE